MWIIHDIILKAQTIPGVKYCLITSMSDMRYQSKLLEEIDTYKALVLEGVINTAQEQPEWPQVLKTEFQDEVCHQN